MDEEAFNRFVEVYESQIKQNIMNLLEIFHELSLTELSKKLGKSKSTISKHVKEMQEITVHDNPIINVREQKYRGSIKQKLFSKNNSALFFGKTYKDLKHYSNEEIYKLLKNEEHLINLRLFTLLRDTISLALDHLNEFYTRLSPRDINNEFLENIYKFNTCIPRINYFSKDEYIEYREKFVKFDEEILHQFEKKRAENHDSENSPREYLVSHALLPIKRIFENEYF